MRIEQERSIDLEVYLKSEIKLKSPSIIAKDLGVSPSTVCRMLTRSKIKIYSETISNRWKQRRL